MSTALADTLRSEGSSLAAKGQQNRTAMNDSAEVIIGYAEKVAENAAIYGDKTSELFAKCEASLRVLMKASAQCKGQDDALVECVNRVQDDASPDDVKKAFTAAVTELTSADELALEERYAPLAKLRKIVADSDVSASRASGGAGPSGTAGDDDDLGEDGIAMTQAVRSTRCPLMQVEMTSTGELRPMKPPCCNTSFSYKAIADFLKGKSTITCPKSGCTAKFGMAQLKDDKELAKIIKKAGR